MIERFWEVGAVKVRKPFLVALLFTLLAGAVFICIYAFIDNEPKRGASPRTTFSPPFDQANVYQSVPQKVPKRRPGSPCRALHFGFDGNPRKFEGDILARYLVPKGRVWRLTNTTVMMERHHGGPFAVAGEWTGVIGGRKRNGDRFYIAISSLDNGSGIALQGQGPVDVHLDAGQRLAFWIWLRPYTSSASGNRVLTDRANYYYTIGGSGTDCPSERMDTLD